MNFQWMHQLVVDRWSIGGYLLSSDCGADRIALCFFFTSSTFACILSIISRISSTSLKKSSMNPSRPSTLTATSSGPTSSSSLWACNSHEMKGEQSISLSQKKKKSWSAAAAGAAAGHKKKLKWNLFVSLEIACSCPCTLHTWQMCDWLSAKTLSHPYGIRHGRNRQTDR